MIVSYTAACPKCGVENRLPLTGQDLPEDQIQMNIFECGNCGARLENKEDHDLWFKQYLERIR